MTVKVVTRGAVISTTLTLARCILPAGGRGERRSPRLLFGIPKSYPSHDVCGTRTACRVRHPRVRSASSIELRVSRVRYEQAPLPFENRGERCHRYARRFSHSRLRLQAPARRSPQVSSRGAIRYAGLSHAMGLRGTRRSMRSPTTSNCNGPDSAEDRLAIARAALEAQSAAPTALLVRVARCRRGTAIIGSSVLRAMRK